MYDAAAVNPVVFVDLLGLAVVWLHICDSLVIELAELWRHTDTLKTQKKNGLSEKW